MASGKQWPKPFDISISGAKKYAATLTTNKGVFEIELFVDKAPQTVNNFVNLAREGFYDKTPFHRIVSGFVIQGGDPTGTGSGGPGYRFGDELPTDLEYDRGALAMANAGSNTNGSQFFVCLADLRGKLPKNYSIFGKVTSGLDVVDVIARTPTKRGSSGENSSPTESITLESVTVTES